MSPKPLPVFAKMPSIGLPIRPLPYPPTDPNCDRRNPNAPSNMDTQIVPANQADIDNPDDHDQEEQHVVNNNNVPETPSKFAAIGLEQMVLASPRYQPGRPRTMGAYGESFLQQVMRGPDEESFMQRAMRLQQEQCDRYPRRDRNESGRRHPPPRTINAVNRFAENDTDEREKRHPPPPRRIEGDNGLTATRNTRAVTPPVQTPVSRMMPPPQTPASRMPPPQTPASRMKVPQSPASRLLKRTASPAYIVRSTGTHVGVDATSSVVRVLFPSPSPKHNVSEFQPVRPRAGDDQPRRQSRVRTESFPSPMDEDTEMASPSVATAERPTGETDQMTTPQSRTGEKTQVITPEYQTGGSPPMPQTPRTPRTWISPSQITPAIEARMRGTPVYEYRNLDERMEMTPSPPKVEPASPDDRKMEDALWTPSKQGASSNIAGLRQKVAAAENLTPAEYKSAIFNSVPVGVAMAQDFARSQHVSPIEKPATAQDGLSPGTTTMRTLISTEITTTIKTTPSPLQSPTPTPKPTDNRRRNAAKPQKTADAPRREISSTSQRKGRGGAGKNQNQRHSAKPTIPGGINRRQELRTEPRYTLRDSTRSIMPGIYSMTPVRNRPFKAESPAKSK